LSGFLKMANGSARSPSARPKETMVGGDVRGEGKKVLLPKEVVELLRPLGAHG
jgi:hypothetical protein